MIDREAFEVWLRGEGYAERTIGDTVMSADGIARCVDEGRSVPRGLWYRARRLLQWAEASGHPIAAAPQLQLTAQPRPGLAGDGRRTAKRAARARSAKLKQESFTDEDWARLVQAILAEPSREARVLEVMAISGLRIGDALRIERAALYESFETGRLTLSVKGEAFEARERTLSVVGPLRTALERAGAVWANEEERERRKARDMAEWVTGPSEAQLPIDSARRMVYRRLKRIGGELGLRGRIHLHRMRRTIAVQALRLTGGDVATVGQLLGHAPGSRATYAYIDEARPDDVARVQGEVFGRFGGQNEDE